MTLKRVFDLIVAFSGLMLLWPVLLLLAYLIYKEDRGPVFFRQTRVGLNGQLFKIFKFRTMLVDAESLGEKITTSNDSRVTTIGTTLRKFKLDELPQLINVLIGDMSVVGPRPEVPEYIAFLNEDQRKLILSVKPGITDRASIEFRNENDLLINANNPIKIYKEVIQPKKVKYYIEYTNHHNLLVDIRIIIDTIKVVAFGR